MESLLTCPNWDLRSCGKSKVISCYSTNFNNVLIAYPTLHMKVVRFVSLAVCETCYFLHICKNTLDDTHSENICFVRFYWPLEILHSLHYLLHSQVVCVTSFACYQKQVCWTCSSVGYKSLRETHSISALDTLIAYLLSLNSWQQITDVYASAVFSFLFFFLAHPPSHWHCVVTLKTHQEGNDLCRSFEVHQELFEFTVIQWNLDLSPG